MIENKEWQEVCDAPNGHIFRDWFEDGIRCLIMRGPCSLVAYVGIPKDHPLTAYGYNNIPLREHWWETYDGKYDGKTGYYWYGWDYTRTDNKLWTVRMIEDEIKEAAGNWQNFAILMAKRLVNEIISLERNS